MVFQGENVVLEEDVFKKDRKFFPSLLEWVADSNAVQVIAHRTAGGAMFTVPDRQTLFITTMFINSEDSSTGVGGQANIEVIMADDSVKFILGSIDTTATGTHSNVLTQTFPMPIRIDAKERVMVAGTIPGAFSAGFTGFLLPKRIGERTFI